MSEEIEYPPEESQPESVRDWENMMTGMSDKLIREFTTDNAIPEEIQDKNWSLLSKHTILSNLDDVDKIILIRSMRNMLTKRRQFMPYYKITPNMLDKDDQVTLLSQNLSTRAVGSNRERILLGKGVMEKRLITEGDGKQKAGFGGKIKGFFGLGGSDY